MVVQNGQKLLFQLEINVSVFIGGTPSSIMIEEMFDIVHDIGTCYEGQADNKHMLK